MTDHLSNVVGHHTDSYHKVIRMLGTVVLWRGWTYV